MGVELFDLWTTLLFLFGLVMVTRLNRQLRLEDRKSYNHVCFGLLILAGVSLAYYLFWHGFHEHDWYQAERELRTRRNSFAWG